MIDEEALSKLIKAGRIAKEARERVKRRVKPGMSILDLAMFVENTIKELGGEPAFPVNVGVNEIAAHYTPVFDDKGVVPDNSVVKIDIGVHVDGYIADTAITVSFNPAFEGLVEAAREALEKAIEVLKPGIRVSEIGGVVEKTIKSRGYKPIKNLSGHAISRYTIHSGITIPNYHDVFARHRLDEGVYAIEPFATNGAGLVRELNVVTIYSLKPGTWKIPPAAKHFYEFVLSSRKSLPFTLRWYARSMAELSDLERVLVLLKASRALHEYPVLVEKDGGLVAQFEHTIVVLEKEIIVTTE